MIQGNPLFIWVTEVIALSLKIGVREIDRCWQTCAEVTECERSVPAGSSFWTTRTLDPAYQLHGEALQLE